jgi:hypothetical protein
MQINRIQMELDICSFSILVPFFFLILFLIAYDCFDVFCIEQRIYLWKKKFSKMQIFYGLFSLIEKSILYLLLVICKTQFLDVIQREKVSKYVTRI